MRVHCILLFVVGILLTGLGELAILPVFEGFDEPSHYSGMQQVADTGTVPAYQRSMLSQEVMDYHRIGPAPYSSLKPPFMGYGGMTYRAFADSPELQAQYVEAYRNPHPRTPYQPGTDFNYEAQHPPLYYIVMAPLVKLTQSLPLVPQLFILRLGSFLLACVGMAAGLWGSIRYYPSPRVKRPIYAGFLLYPFIVPMFFPEFARLGNDSLCVFFTGIIWALLLRFLADESNKKLPVAIGICFGLGLLTKAFFLPILTGLILFLIWRLWIGRADRALSRARLMGLALILLPAFLFGGWWYVARLLTDGSMVGYEYLRLAEGGGLLHMLRGKLTLPLLLQGIAGIIASWQWAATWSLVRIDDVLRLPLLALAGWLLLEYLLEAKRHPLSHPAWLPLWLSAPFIGGLFYHDLIMVALQGANAPAGWYLNVLAPAVAFAFALGIKRIAARAGARLLLSVLLIYSLAFLVMVTWSQAALFAGCAVKSDTKYYAFDGSMFCLDRLAAIKAHLDVLGWASPGALSFGLGLGCCLVSLLMLRRRAIAE